MKKILLITAAIIIATDLGFSQCLPFIKVDTFVVSANQTVPLGINLPLWLKAGQTIAPVQMVNEISAIEFTVNGTALEFSQVLTITNSVTVPAGKVWKVEAIMKQYTSGTANSVTYTVPGTYSFKVPGCASYICIEAWSGGGSGGTDAASGCSGGGGGGGAYGQQCYTVTPGATYSVVVGAGGNASYGGAGSAGGNSSFGTLMTVTGGTGGAAGCGGTGGTGGSTSATLEMPGQNGNNGYGSGSNGKGGNGGNGGAGGAGSPNTGTDGTYPGGGGGGGNHYYGSRSGAGAAGKVIVTW